MITYPKGYNLSNPSTHVQEFIDRNEAWQKRELESRRDPHLWTNYTLLQVWDIVGLYFCCQELGEDHVEPVPTGYSGKSVRLTMRPTAANRVAFEPYPFAKRPCHLQLAFKRLPQTSFDDVGAFRKAYFQAENDLMRFELV
jgi:hypothetical protein